jgi:hypothetical protein
VGLFDHVIAARATDHLQMVDVSQARNFPDRGSRAPELGGADRVWDIAFSQKPLHEGLGGHGLAVSLEQDEEHEPVLVHCSPAAKRPHGEEWRAHARPFTTTAALAKKSQCRTPSTEVQTSSRNQREPGGVPAGAVLQRTEGGPSGTIRGGFRGGVASSWASVHDDADLNAALVQHFLHVSVTQGKAVVQPNGVLNDGYGEAARRAQARSWADQRR